MHSGACRTGASASGVFYGGGGERPDCEVRRVNGSTDRQKFVDVADPEARVGQRPRRILGRRMPVEALRAVRDLTAEGALQKKVKKRKKKAREVPRTKAALLEQGPEPMDISGGPVQAPGHVGLDWHPDNVPTVVVDENENLPQVPDDDDLMEELFEPDAPDARKRKLMMLDDLPISIKRRRLKGDQSSLPVLVQLARPFVVSQGIEGKDEWLFQSSLRKIATVLLRPVYAVKVHAEPRQSLYAHDRYEKLSRLTVLLDKNGQGTFHEDSPSCRASTCQEEGAWCGMTVFFADRLLQSDVVTIRFDTPQGVYTAMTTVQGRDDIKEVYKEWADQKSNVQKNDVYQLVLRPGQKELYQRFFNKDETEQFSRSDRAEWQQWIQHGVIRRCHEGEDVTNVIVAPMRFVRTNKGTIGLMVKSRLIIPGHRDPQIGLYRTDAPTTSLLAVFTTATLAISMGFNLLTFDVSTTFLSGQELKRDCFVKVPKEGLPQVDGMPRLAGLTILQVLKGAYGLTEAPRLWYLRARELLVSIGVVELAMARAVFALRRGKKVIAFLTLHVDDGLLMGKKGSADFEAVVKAINERFNIKFLEDLDESDPL